MKVSTHDVNVNREDISLIWKYSDYYAFQPFQVLTIDSNCE